MRYPASPTARSRGRTSTTWRLARRAERHWSSARPPTSGPTARDARARRAPPRTGTLPDSPPWRRRSIGTARWRASNSTTVDARCRAGSAGCRRSRRIFPCSVNPDAGAAESRRGRAARPALRRGPSGGGVVVVGAGPAGLEAARLAAGRGPKVRLIERESRAAGSGWPPRSTATPATTASSTGTQANSTGWAWKSAPAPRWTRRSSPRCGRTRSSSPPDARPAFPRSRAPDSRASPTSRSGSGRAADHRTSARSGAP